MDAFTESAFKGNPAAVCFLEQEDDKSDDWLQAVAAEFNISETCYLTPISGSVGGSSPPRFRLRWFTPVAEVFAFLYITWTSDHVVVLCAVCICCACSIQR